MLLPSPQISFQANNEAMPQVYETLLLIEKNQLPKDPPAFQNHFNP